MSGRNGVRVGASDTSLARFTRTASAVSENVIASYSTSFGLATRLLGQRHRSHVRNIYALVRVADEIVDGVASEAGLTTAAQLETLERYAAQTHLAMRTGYSSDLVIHSFAQTARESGIDASLTEPFFASMRSDLLGAGDGRGAFDRQAHAEYVHGSAEVVGLMCLRVFLRGRATDVGELHHLEYGARRLGAAFQNINFLRDLGDDTARLGRHYLSGGAITQHELEAWVWEIRRQLADADAVIPLLPRDARAAVRSALALFANLADRIADTPAGDLSRARVRVPDPVKAALVSAAVFRTLTEARA